MPRILSVLAPALLVGCAAHSGGDLTALATKGAEIEGVPTPGQPFATELISIDGETIVVPDPDGRVVVLELIRSADW